MGSVDIACVIVDDEAAAAEEVRSWASSAAPSRVLWVTAAPVTCPTPRNVRHLTYSEVIKTARLVGGYSLLHDGLSIGDGVVVFDDMQFQGVVDDVEKGAGIVLAVNPSAVSKAVVRSGGAGEWHPGRAAHVTCVETGREFASMAEAASSTSVSRQAIGKALRSGGRAGGFHWVRTGTRDGHGGRRVRCEDGRLFDDVESAAKELGVPAQALSLAVDHGIRCRGALWELVDENFR